MKNSVVKVSLLLVCAFIVACGTQKKTGEGKETNNTAVAKKERIILHKPEDLQDQIHQVDTPMNFIEVKRDTTKVR